MNNETLKIINAKSLVFPADFEWQICKIHYTDVFVGFALDSSMKFSFLLHFKGVFSLQSQMYWNVCQNTEIIKELTNGQVALDFIKNTRLITETNIFCLKNSDGVNNLIGAESVELIDEVIDKTDIWIFNKS